MHAASNAAAARIIAAIRLDVPLPAVGELRRTFSNEVRLGIFSRFRSGLADCMLTAHNPGITSGQQDPVFPDTLLSFTTEMEFACIAS